MTEYLRKWKDAISNKETTPIEPTNEPTTQSKVSTFTDQYNLVKIIKELQADMKDFKTWRQTTVDPKIEQYGLNIRQMYDDLTTNIKPSIDQAFVSITNAKNEVNNMASTVSTIYNKMQNASNGVVKDLTYLGEITTTWIRITKEETTKIYNSFTVFIGAIYNNGVSTANAAYVLARDVALSASQTAYPIKDAVGNINKALDAAKKADLWNAIDHVYKTFCILMSQSLAREFDDHYKGSNRDVLGEIIEALKEISSDTFVLQKAILQLSDQVKSTGETYIKAFTDGYKKIMNAQQAYQDAFKAVFVNLSKNLSLTT